MEAQERLDLLINDLDEIMSPLGVLYDDDVAVDAIIIEGVQRLVAENERLRAALKHAVHKVEQTLAGQYADGAALESVLIVARAALARPEGGAQ